MSSVASPRSYSIQLGSYQWCTGLSVATDTQDLEALGLHLSPLPVIDGLPSEGEVAPNNFFMGPGCESSYEAATMVESPSSIPSLLGLLNTYWEPSTADVLVSQLRNTSTGNNAFLRVESNESDGVPSEKLLKPIELLPEYEGGEEYESSGEAMDVDVDYSECLPYFCSLDSVPTFPLPDTVVADA